MPQLTEAQIKYAHLVDTTERQRTLALRISRTTSDLLVDALHAARAGRYHITEEFLERSIAALVELAQKMHNPQSYNPQSGAKN